MQMTLHTNMLTANPHQLDKLKSADLSDSFRIILPEAHFKSKLFFIQKCSGFRIFPDFRYILFRGIHRDIPVVIHKAEEAKDIPHVCLELVPLPGRNGHEIPLMHFVYLISQKHMSLSFENHDHMHMMMMFKRRKASFFHLEIPELYRQVRFIVKKDLLRHIPEHSRVFLVNMGFNTIPSVVFFVETMNHDCILLFFDYWYFYFNIRKGHC